MTSQVFLRSLTGLALSVSVFAQSHPPSGPGGGANHPSAPTMPTGPPISTITPDLTPRPLFISGKVAMEDGTVPPDSTMIQLVCRGNPRSIGYTDSKGNFGIDLNNRIAQMTMADASETSSSSIGGPGTINSSPNNFSNTMPSTAGTSGQLGGDRDLMSCDLQAALPGYRSDVFHLGARKSMDDPNVGILIMHRLANVEGTTISATSAMAPKPARKAMEKAQNAIKKEKWDEAQTELQKAVALYPKYASAWLDLGRLQERLNDSTGARKSFAMALEADPKLVTPYLELASVAAAEKNWQETSDYSDHALNLNPVDFPEAYLLNALSNFRLKKLDVAEKSARQGLEHDPEHKLPAINEILGAVLAQKHDYAAAAEQFRKYIHYSPEGSDTSKARKELADLEKALSEAKK